MKTNIPVNAEQAIFRLQSGYFRIEEGDPVNQLLYFVNKDLAKEIVTAFIGLKPFPVIVLTQFRQELYYFCIHPLIYYLKHKS